MLSNSHFQRPLRVGITGGIGSGKTTACKIFEEFGIPIYYADLQAKRLMQEDPIVRQGLIELFGPAAFSENGTLNRSLISKAVFENAPLLSQLNGIVHPAVFRDVERWHGSFSNVPYTLKEAAILFESGSYQEMHLVVTVSAPVELRISRVMQRDGVSREAVAARMANQWPDEQKVELADFVIVNDGRQMVLPQVWRIHQAILSLAGG